MTDQDREAFEVCREFAHKILFAASKRYRALDGRIPMSELMALAQQGLCVLAGLMPGAPSNFGRLDHIRATAPAGEVDRWVQHELDWWLANAARYAVQADIRSRGGTVGAGGKVTRQPHVSLDAILATEDGEPDRFDRTDLLAYSDDISNPDFWDGCSGMFVARYRDGYTTDELAMVYNTSGPTIRRHMRDERLALKYRYMEWEAA